MNSALTPKRLHKITSESIEVMNERWDQNIMSEKTQKSTRSEISVESIHVIISNTSTTFSFKGSIMVQSKLKVSVGSGL